MLRPLYSDWFHLMIPAHPGSAVAGAADDDPTLVAV
jgi:hypothetical protein